MGSPFGWVWVCIAKKKTRPKAKISYKFVDLNSFVGCVEDGLTTWLGVGVYCRNKPRPRALHSQK